MAFDTVVWKERAASLVVGAVAWAKERTNQDLPYLAYGALCGISASPLAGAE